MSRLIQSVLMAGLFSGQLLCAHPATNAAPAVAASPIPGPAASPAPAAVVVARKTPGYPFRGKLAVVDLSRSTIQIGKSTYYITPQTTITRNGKAVHLNEGVIGEQAVGYARKGADGRAVAASLRFGPKVEAGSTPTAASAKPGGKR